MDGQIEHMVPGSEPTPDAGEPRPAPGAEAARPAVSPLPESADAGVEPAAIHSGATTDPEPVGIEPAPGEPAPSAAIDAPEPVPPAATPVEPAAAAPAAGAEMLPEEAPPSAMADPGFAELLDKSLERTRPVRAGDRLRAVVQRIEDQWAFLDYGGPSEALIESRELRDQEGNLKIGVGERIDVTVATAGDQVIVNRMVKKTRDRSVLKQAFANHATVEGKITGTNKGGFDILVSGFRAFCPISQIDRVYCSDPQAFVGKTLPFRIIEYKEGGRRIVISRRALLEDDRKKQADETRTRLQVGDEIDGVVVRLQPFGAFVDIGGIDGLVHVSELRHARVVDPAEVVQVGGPLRVKVIGIEKLGDEKNERISLSAKALEGDPWGGVADRLKVGDIAQGRVLRLMNYGAFVEVLPGVEGLLHVTELGQKVRHPREAVTEGDTVEVRVLELDPGRKRLSLSRRLDPATDLPELAPRPKLEVGMAVAGKVSNVKPYGVFVRIHEPVSGVDGLLPADETHVERGADLASAFPSGSEVEAEVLRIDERGRIRLTQRSAEERAKTRERDGARPRGEGGRGGEHGHDGARGGRRERDRDRERDAAEPAGEGERRESKVAAGFGIMASAFKRVLDGH